LAYYSRDISRTTLQRIKGYEAREPIQYLLVKVRFDMAPIVEDKSIKTKMLLFDECLSSVMSARLKIMKDPHKTAVVHL